MTAPESVSREEMIELACLEALGLLDEVETTHFNRLFHYSSAGLQDEIRAVQAAIVSDQNLLPVEEPAASLKGRTVTAVHDAMTAEQASLAPIATIGPRRNGGTESERDLGYELMQSRLAHEASRSEVVRFRFASAMWRAAAIVLACGLLASILLYGRANWWSERISELALSGTTRSELLRQLGPQFDAFHTKNCLVTGLAATKSGFSGAATAYVDRQNGAAFVLALGLPEGARYTVRVIGEDGTSSDVGNFEAHSHFSAVRIDNAEAKVLAAAHWEIVDPSGAVVLRS